MDDSTRIELLKSYISDDPHDAFSKYALALEYIKRGDDEIAEKLMSELFNNQPHYLANYYHYGKLLERKGAIEMASSVYEAGLIEARKQNNAHTFSELQSAKEEIS